MRQILIIALIAYFIYAGLFFLMIAFGFRKPKFKNFQQQVRFETTYAKYHILLKIGSILFLVSFCVMILRSGVLKVLFPN